MANFEKNSAFLMFQNHKLACFFILNKFCQLSLVYAELTKVGPLKGHLVRFQPFTQTTGTCTIKHFTAVIYIFSL
jgi:hypothetical protein